MSHHLHSSSGANNPCQALGKQKPGPFFDAGKSAILGRRVTRGREMVIASGKIVTGKAAAKSRVRKRAEGGMTRGNRR
jgi:hypothetical protein